MTQSLIGTLVRQLQEQDILFWQFPTGSTLYYADKFWQNNSKRVTNVEAQNTRLNEVRETRSGGGWYRNSQMGVFNQHSEWRHRLAAIKIILGNDCSNFCTSTTHWRKLIWNAHIKARLNVIKDENLCSDRCNNEFQWQWRQHNIEGFHA